MQHYIIFFSFLKEMYILVIVYILGLNLIITYMLFMAWLNTNIVIFDVCFLSLQVCLRGIQIPWQGEHWKNTENHLCQIHKRLMKKQ